MTDSRRWFRKDGDVTARLDRQNERIGELERELARVSPQLAALEERVALLGTPPAERDLGTVLESSDPDAAALLEAIRAEHARVRARISAAAKYEERLRQLEEKVSRLGG